MPISSNNNSAAGGHLPLETAANGTKRHSLLVTLDDGTTTETQGSVTRIQPSSGPSSPIPPSGMAG